MYVKQLAKHPMMPRMVVILNQNKQTKTYDMMMKTYKLLALLSMAFAVVLHASCSTNVKINHSGKQVVVKNKLNYFNKIEIQVPCDVEFVQTSDTTNACSIRIEGPQGDVECLQATVNNNTLRLDTKRFMNKFFGSMDGLNIKVYVSSPDLVAVDVPGSGSLVSNKHVDTDNLNISIAGSGDVTFADVVCDKFTADVRGSGEITMKKLDTKSTDAQIYGSGDMTLSLIKSLKTNITIKGSGEVDATLTDCGDTECSISGSGDITLQGNTRTLTSECYGSGDVDSDELKVSGDRITK